MLKVWSVLRVGVGQDGDNLVTTISVRVRGRAMTLLALGVGCVLLATITGPDLAGLERNTTPSPFILSESCRILSLAKHVWCRVSRSVNSNSTRPAQPSIG